MIVLSGDIGGTHTRLQLTEFMATKGLIIIKSEKYDNDSYSSLLEIINTFLIDTNIGSMAIDSACFGVAGPVVNETVMLTNLPWVINVLDIKNTLKIPKVELINDFTAIGYGLEILKSDDLITLRPGKHRIGGLKAYIGAGTGLGVGFVCNYLNMEVVYPTEGGHIDFAPVDEEQLNLLKYLRNKFHRVSLERVLSGQGLVNIYNFVRDSGVANGKENQDLCQMVTNRHNIDIAAAISEYAIKHKDVMATYALNIFMKIYGAAVGNLALTLLPYGGMYIVGGIAPKLISQFQNASFFAGFQDKGRISELLKDIPMYIVLDTNVGLLGAAMYAVRYVSLL